MRPCLVIALALVAAPARAQQGPAGSTCNVQIDSSRHSQFHLDNGAYDTFAGGGVWAHCREQPTRMYADSVAWYPGNDLLYLMRHVRFEDSTSILNADKVTYYLRQERLYAEGNVYTKNLHTGSDLRGPNLDYYRAAPPLRDTVETYARGRPTMHFYSAPSGTRPDSAEPFVVVADRSRMRGNDQMWGGGNVTIDRSDLAARGDSAELDLGHAVGALLGQPQVNGTGNDAYHLDGNRITFRLTPSHEIRRVISAGQANARGTDWRLKADTIDMTLDSGKVQLVEAWGRRQRPDAVSGLHTIVADSLDIHMPAQLLRLVWAYGHARTTTRDTTVREDTTARDTTARDTTARDTTARRGAALVRADEDWITGDTLRADFAVVRDSAATRPTSELQHMTAFGSARALYHVEAADTSAARGRKGVNYSRGRRIDIATAAHSKVQTVDIVGTADGVYLEPLPPPRDTTRARADSTRSPAADTTRARAGAPGAAPDTGAPATPAPPPPAGPARPPGRGRP
ncbi:MAG TPA: hypothetical protein VMF70_03360 [Gemmatimonadales bacterium]|nr:hypothetical protein [Gemmatimonadales bacterium]